MKIDISTGIVLSDQVLDRKGTNKVPSIDIKIEDPVYKDIRIVSVSETSNGIRNAKKVIVVPDRINNLHKNHRTKKDRIDPKVIDKKVREDLVDVVSNTIVWDGSKGVSSSYRKELQTRILKPTDLIDSYNRPIGVVTYIKHRIEIIKRGTTFTISKREGFRRGILNWKVVTVPDDDSA